MYIYVHYRAVALHVYFLIVCKSLDDTLLIRHWTHISTIYETNTWPIQCYLLNWLSSFFFLFLLSYLWSGLVLDGALRCILRCNDFAFLLLESDEKAAFLSIFLWCFNPRHQFPYFYFFSKRGKSWRKREQKEKIFSDPWRKRIECISLSIVCSTLLWSFL